MRPGSIGGRIYAFRKPHPAGGGGEVFKAAKRMARTEAANSGFQDHPLSSTSSSSTDLSKHALTLSSSAHNHAADTNTNAGFDNEWEYVDDYFHDYHHNYHVNHVFGSVPSSDEVNHALLSLQRIGSRIEMAHFDRVKRVIQSTSPSTSTTGETTCNLDKDVADVMEITFSKDSSVLDWVEPPMHAYDQSSSPSNGIERVYDAVHLLQNDPTVVSMVEAVSTDNAVWNAILNNKVVREVRESYLNETRVDDSNENSNPSKTNPNIVKWMLDNSKAKLLEVIGMITRLLGEILRPPLDIDKSQDSDNFLQKLNSTFVLTFVVLLIVVVTRAHKS